MSKVAHYLQEHLLGEVHISADVRRHFSQDASVLQMMPSFVVYPRNENDVRKTARFTWQLAERGRVIPITARGAGSDLSGAAIGSGVILAFTAHMNKITSLDSKKNSVTVEPGINYDKLQQTLLTHGLFIPAYPASMQYATFGGAVANNASGEQSVKYGATDAYVDSLRVVLANGEVIETKRLSRKELSKKMGLSSFEGEIYRTVDALIEEHMELIGKSKDSIRSRRNSAGYNLFDVKHKNGSFDLTPLIVGSQGTLGIVTEVTAKAEAHNPSATLVVVSFNDLELLHDFVPKVLELKPSAFEMINRAAVKHVQTSNPNQLNSVIDNPNAALTFFIEFDDFKDSSQKKAAKRLKKLVEKGGGTAHIIKDAEDRERAWKLRESVSTILIHHGTNNKSVPVAEDVAVPPESLIHFLARAEKIYEQHGLPATAWGHAGDGVVRMQPILDLAQIGDRQKFFKISEEIYHATLELGGTITASHGEGRLRAPYIPQQYGAEMATVFARLKKIFDPHGTLNPGVKVGTNFEDIKSMMRSDYSLGHRLDHMPRS